MKAKEYLERFLKEGHTVEALQRVIVDMIVETRELAKTRRVNSSEGWFSILDEANLKFDSFFRQSGGKLDDDLRIRPDAFRNMVKKHFPEVFVLWNARHGGKLLPEA
jgi:hypothetical protein